MHGGGGVFGQIPKIPPTQTRLPEEETDSVMTEKYTTHGQPQGDQETQFDKKESVSQEAMGTGRNPSQQLPNTDPMSNGANN